MARRVVRPCVAISRRYWRKALIRLGESGSTWTRKRLARISVGVAPSLPKPIRTTPNHVNLSSISRITTNHVGPDAFVRAAERSSAGFFGGEANPRIVGLGRVCRALLDGGGRMRPPLRDSYFPANSFLTASLTTLPSTRIPAAAKRAMAAFITVPISFIAGVGVISAIAARTPATISSSPASLGR